MNLKQLPPLTLSLIAAGVLAVGSLGFLASQSRAADNHAATAKPALTVSLTQAKAGSLPIKLSANGSVTAWQEASVGAEANGLRVAELHAAIGDHVKRGQLLASFAAESVQADVALARASVAEASANAAEAAANADRARAVQGTGALSAQQINQYLTAELAAKARVDSAKAQLDAQQLRLKHTRLEAPDDGIISARNATVGSVVGAGTEMFKLIRNGRLEWRGEVTSSEIGRIAAGTAVVVTAPGGAQMKGRVRMVAPTVDATTRNGLVYVDLIGLVSGGTEPHAVGSAGTSFKQGMFARGEFALGSSGGLTVANTAIVVRDGFSYVYRVGGDNRVSQLKVQTGRMLGDQVELLGGVKAEDKLVASGASFLSEGDLVKVVDSKPNVPVAPVSSAQAATK
jgi:RND family efflux transporter MFP subunit